MKKDCDLRCNIVRSLVEDKERLQQQIRDAELNEWSRFQLKPFKYKPKFEIFHWIIFKCVKQKYEWCGYQIPQHIERMWDEYHIINFETGEIEKVEEDFINDLVECSKSKK